MSPLKYETMMILPMLRPERLVLHGRRDIVRCVRVCWAVMYLGRGSPFEARDYHFGTLGLDGIE